MVEVGKTYTAFQGHIVTIIAIYGNTVYYHDQYGIYSHKTQEQFVAQYIGK